MKTKHLIRYAIYYLIWLFLVIIVNYLFPLFPTQAQETTTIFR